MSQVCAFFVWSLPLLMTIISYQPVVWRLLGLLGVWMQLKINFPGSAPSTTVTGPGSGAEQPSLAAALSSSFLLPTASRRKRKIIQDEKFLEAIFLLLGLLRSLVGTGNLIQLTPMSNLLLSLLLSVILTTILVPLLMTLPWLRCPAASPVLRARFGQPVFPTNQ